MLPVTENHPAFIGTLSSKKKWIALTLIVTAIAIATITQLASQGMLPFEMQSVQAFKFLGSNRTIGFLVSEAFFAAGLFFGAAYTKDQEEFTQKTQDLMREHLGFDLSPNLMEKVWDQALHSHHITWDPTTVTSEHLKKIEEALRHCFVYSGRGVEHSFQKENPASGFLSYLATGDAMPQLDSSLMRAVFVEKDETLAAHLRADIKRELAKLCATVPQSKQQDRVFEGYVGNLLGLIPFTYPSIGEEFTFPVKRKDGSWDTATYKIDKVLKLSPSWLSSPIPCYCLTSSTASPLLLFLGSTYPAGEGAIATYLSDFTPGLSVGHASYLYGKDEITEWLKDKSDVHLVGLSLGGAMTMHVLRNHREKIGKVQAYNPPGLHEWNWDRDCPFDEGHEILIYGAEGDLVSTLGYFPEGRCVHLFHLISGEAQKGVLASHSQCYFSHPQVTLLRIDVARENQRALRDFYTVSHLVLSPVLVALPLLLFNLFHKTGRALSNLSVRSSEIV